MPSSSQALWRRAPAALARAAGRPLRLVLTDNRSVLLSFRREAGVLLLRLHQMFLHAPDGVVSALNALDHFNEDTMGLWRDEQRYLPRAS